MVNYQEERVKLTNKQSNKLKCATKNKEGAILRLNKKKTLKMKNWRTNYFWKQDKQIK